MFAREAKGRSNRSLWLPSLTFLFVLLFILVNERDANLPKTRFGAVHSAGKASHRVYRSRQCDRIPLRAIRTLQKTRQFSVYTFNDGSIVTGVLQAPIAVCVVAVVPQLANEYYTDVPIKGRGPDDIHLLINSSTTAITSLPLLPRETITQPHQKQFYSGILIYQTEIPIFDPGLYLIKAEQEWSNWRWSRQFEILNDSVIVPTKMQVKFTSQQDKDRFLDEPIEQGTVPAYYVYPPTLTIKGDMRDFDARPPCTDALEAAQGRWVVNPLNKNPWTRDEWGWTWEPDHCRLDHYTDEDMFHCLKDANIHIYGNSNLRRVAKTILSGGRWCTDIYGNCQNNDSQEREISTLMLDGARLVESFTELNHKWTFTDEPPVHIPFGRNAHLHFMFLRALSEYPRDWVRYFFTQNYFTSNPDGVHGTFTTDMIYDNSSVRLPQGMENASNPEIVLVGFASWDAAFDSSFDSLQAALPVFRDALLTIFPTSHIVVRLANGMCCKKDWGYFKQRYTGQRIAYVNELIRNVFDNKRFSILDPSPMTGRPEVATDFGEVYTNHPRVSHVRIETQILMNGICEKPVDVVTGKTLPARLRRTRGLALRDATDKEDEVARNGTRSFPLASGNDTESEKLGFLRPN